MSISTSHAEFWAGARAQIPILVGVVPFGMIYGALAINAGLPASLAQAMSAVVFAGSAQFIAVPLFEAGATPLVLVFTTFIVNLRHMLYSTSLAPHIRHLSSGWKLLLAYLLTDEAYVVGIQRYQDDGNSPHKHWYFLGTGLALWATWQTATAIGVFLGARVPAGWGLDFALAVTFIAMLIPSLTSRPVLAAALVGGVVAVLANGLPHELGLLLAVLLGILAGLLVETRLPSKARKPQPESG